MCVYNREKYLADAIESILNQTFTDFEFVIVNDGSTDSSLEILKSYSCKDPRIILIENEKNLGIVKSVTRGIKHCTGKYIARMDSDDISHPHRLQMQYEFMETHPEIDALGSGFEFINEGGSNTGKHKELPSDPLIIRFQMFYHCVLHNPTAMTRYDYYCKFNENQQEENQIADDYHFWLRMNFDHLYSNLPDHLLFYRLHSTQISNSENSAQLESVLVSAREGFEKLTGRQIPIDVIRTFYFIKRFTCRDKKTIRAAMNVVYQSQRCFERFNQLSIFQKKSTRRYSYEKLKSVAVKYKEYPAIYLLGMIYLFRLLPINFFIEMISKLLGKKLRWLS